MSKAVSGRYGLEIVPGVNNGWTLERKVLQADAREYYSVDCCLYRPPEKCLNEFLWRPTRATFN